MESREKGFGFREIVDGGTTHCIKEILDKIITGVFSGSLSDQRAVGVE